MDQEWSPDAVRMVAEALYGPTWQTLLAQAIAASTGQVFPTVRIRHWYLSKNGRPIPRWLQERLSSIFIEGLLEHDRARSIAVRELTLRRGDVPWPMTVRDDDQVSETAG